MTPSLLFFFVLCDLLLLSLLLYLSTCSTVESPTIFVALYLLPLLVQTDGKVDAAGVRGAAPSFSTLSSSPWPGLASISAPPFGCSETLLENFTHPSVGIRSQWSILED
jgi:hypothetical protein